MAVDVMQGVAQGRVWSGRDALSVGLVDALGGVSTAVAIAKQAAGLGTLAGTCSPTSRPMKIPWVQLRNAVLFCYQQSTACRGAAPTSPRRTRLPEDKDSARFERSGQLLAAPKNSAMSIGLTAN